MSGSSNSNERGIYVYRPRCVTVFQHVGILIYFSINHDGNVENSFLVFQREGQDHLKFKGFLFILK